MYATTRQTTGVRLNRFPRGRLIAGIVIYVPSLFRREYT